MAEQADLPAERADLPAEDEPLMTLAEAAAVTGRLPEAIRAMIRRGKLKARKGNDGRTLVGIPAVMRRPGGQPEHGRAAGRGHDNDSRVAGLEMAVEEWRAAAEEARLAAAIAAAERDAAKASAAAELAARDLLIQELKTILAEMKQPWWQRWFGRQVK